MYITLINSPSPWEQSMIRRIISIQIPVPRFNPWNFIFSVHAYDISKFIPTLLFFSSSLFFLLKILKFSQMTLRFSRTKNSIHFQDIQYRATKCSLLQHLYAPWAQYSRMFFTIWTGNKNLHHDNNTKCIKLFLKYCYTFGNKNNKW